MDTHAETLDVRADPLVDTARRTAAFLAVFDVALGLTAIRRPDVLRKLLGFPEGADRFYARWGVTMLSYSVVQTMATLAPSPATFNAVAAIRGVEIPADFSARYGVPGVRRYAHPFASAFNLAATTLFLTAARRLRRTPG